MCLCYLFSAKTAWQLVNRKADFFTKRIDSNRFAQRIESIRIANWNALVVADLFNTADNDFFHRVKTNSDHVLQAYLPDPTNIPYQLCNRSHNFTLINKTKFLNDTDFIIRMLYILVLTYYLSSPIVLMLFAILETFILLSISLLLCMYII